MVTQMGVHIAFGIKHKKLYEDGMKKAKAMKIPFSELIYRALRAYVDSTPDMMVYPRRYQHARKIMDIVLGLSHPTEKRSSYLISWPQHMLTFMNNQSDGDDGMSIFKLFCNRAGYYVIAIESRYSEVQPIPGSPGRKKRRFEGYVVNFEEPVNEEDLIEMKRRVEVVLSKVDYPDVLLEPFSTEDVKEGEIFGTTTQHF